LSLPAGAPLPGSFFDAQPATSNAPVSATANIRILMSALPAFQTSRIVLATQRKSGSGVA